MQNRYFGYDYRSSQPCAAVEAKLALGTARDMGRINRWLSEFFKIELAQTFAADRKLDDPLQSLALGAANRALALYGDLMRGAGIPVFDTGRVLRLEPLEDEQNTWRAAVALPVVDRLSADVFAKTFWACADTIAEHLSIQPDADSAQGVFNRLNDTVIAALEKVNPFEPTTLALCRLAHDQGLPWRHVGRGVVRLGLGANSRLLFHSSIEEDSAIGAQLCGSKRHTVLLLASAGLPTPQQTLVETPEAAGEAAKKLGWPVVVKPENAARAEGVTIDITSEEAAARAFALAREESETVLIENQIPGLCHRITVAGDKVIYVVKRLPKSVTGNGRDTVEALIEKANARLAMLPAWKKLKEFPLDDIAIKCLAANGLTPQSIPDEGQCVNLRAHATNEWGGDVENLTGLIHPENAKLAVEAVRMFGLKIAGVDLMTTDIARPWHENGAAILELNYMPQIDLRRRESDASNLLPALIDGDGRIPVHIVTGEGELLAIARQLKSRLRSQGQYVHLTSANHSEDEEGRAIIMPASSLFDRTIAMTMRRGVRGLVIIGKPRDLFAQGLPVDRIASVLIMQDDENSANRIAREISARVAVESFQRVAIGSEPAARGEQITG